MPNSPLISTARDNTARHADARASDAVQRQGFDAALQLSVAREPAIRDSSSPARQAIPRPVDAPGRDRSGEPPPRSATSAAMPARPKAGADDGDRPRTSTDGSTSLDADAAADAATDRNSVSAADPATDPDTSMNDPAESAAAALANASSPPPTTASADADAPHAQEASAGGPGTAAVDASATANLIAASVAIGNAAAGAAVNAATQADAEPDDGTASTAARAGRTIKAAAATLPDSAQGDKQTAQPDALPELTAELTRTPARDRLMQDFEQRFESSLARAVGAPGAGGNGVGSPLLVAGLPQQSLPAHAAAPTAHASIATPLSHPAFGDDLAHRVLLFAGQRVQSAEISLTPGELGPIRVSLELRGQEASVQFNAAHAATRSAIEDALPRLREMLAAQGLQLGQADVGDRAPRDQAGRGGADGRPQPGLTDPRASALGAAVDATAAGAIGVRRVGLIDVRV